MTSYDTARFAVLIDAENIAAKFAKPIFKEISQLGEASVRRIYCDVQQPSIAPWLELQAKLGLVTQHQPKTSVGKNASDIALVIDAMDLLHSGRVDSFILVSSDSDFTRLAQRIREQGMDVYGMGEMKTPQAFRMACKRFITVENLDCDSDQRPADQSTQVEHMQLNHAYQLIRNVATVTADSEGWISLGPLGSQLVQRYPDFDSRSYGYKRLSDLVRATERFEENGSGGTLKVREKDTNQAP